ncbi:Protoporphyrinogen oxidase [Trametes elegans]|nr:Protoporphyrinogen oxidase [Trametes elegans]
MGPPRSVTVIGGGLSGLSTAFHLARRFPASSGTRITLLEQSSRLGGWVKSERVRVKDRHGHQAGILLESGPRTLRPASKAILELVHLLDLSSAILAVPRSAPAAKNRYLHIPGSGGLTTIPGSLPSLLVSPLAKILLPAVLNDFRTTNGKVLNKAHPNDESVDAFLTRHFGSDFARTFGSALIHGIYAADSRCWESGNGSLGRGALKEILSLARRRKTQGSASIEETSYELGHVPELVKGVSVYSFEDGIQTLTDAILRYLERQENVDIVRGDGAARLVKNPRNDFQVTTTSGKKIVSSHIVSAVPLGVLHKVLAASSHAPKVSDPALPQQTSRSSTIRHPSLTQIPPFPHPALSIRSGTPGIYAAAQANARAEASSQTPESAASLPILPHLLANPTSSVTVVNIIFPPSETPIHPAGFGYLIPRPSPDYPSPPGSTLGILGTVFDSCSLGGQDVALSADHRAPAFTKVTVMLGGPYGAPSPAPQSPEFLPTLLEALGMHLGHKLPLPEPCLVRVRDHRDCIPTPTVGHVARMEELRAAVRERWGPNAAVIGAGVGGVSVGDCIESGRRVALEF